MVQHITSKHRYLAAYIAEVFGVHKPPIARFGDEQGRSDVFILEADHSPQQGVKSFATIGLSDAPLFLQGKELVTRVEILGACGASFQGFADVLSTAAFCVMNSQWFCAPGVIFPGVVGEHGISTTMSDLYFARPFLWDRLEAVNFEGQDIAWLLAVPVSKAETAFAQQNGPDKLEALFSDMDIDLFDLDRRSVV